MISFYGFLHLHDGESSVVNGSMGSLNHKIKNYVRNAILLSRSLEAHGFSFQLLTNDSGLIRKVVPDVEQYLDLREIEFRTPVPSGVRFYSGHFKIDAFRHLGSLDPEGYVALIDLDMVCINPAPPGLHDAVTNRRVLIYDITHQVVPSAGEDHLRSQLEEILGDPIDLWWSGGEFLAGPPEFFAELAETCESLFEKYLEVSVGRYRVGNEPYQNAALHRMAANGWELVDSGPGKIVGRYWNMPVKHQQPAFSYFASAFLLHLPVDKHVLSLMLSVNPSRRQDFLILYYLLKWLWLPLELFNKGRAQLAVR